MTPHSGRLESLSVLHSSIEHMASETKNVARGSEPREKADPGRFGLPVLPVRDTVLFPNAVLPLTVGRESSVELINSLGDEKQIIVVAQREARVDSPVP